MINKYKAPRGQIVWAVLYDGDNYDEVRELSATGDLKSLDPIENGNLSVNDIVLLRGQFLVVWDDGDIQIWTESSFNVIFTPVV